MKNSLLSIIFLYSIVMQLPMPLHAGMSMLNSSKNKSINQEIEEAEKVIAEYVSSLSPEEQEEFNKSVEMMTEMFSNMSDEEFSQFVGEMFSEEPVPSYEEPAPIKSADVFEEVNVLTNDQKKKTENIIKVIDDIIRQSNIFLVQINSSLEAYKSIDEWGKKGKINNWQDTYEWETIKFDLETFIHILYKIQDKNSDKTFKYMNDLILDETIINNLIQLQTSLNFSVPTIEIVELDIKKLSKKSKAAIQTTLSNYIDSLYTTKLPEQINAIIAKQEPIETKMKESKEEAERVALDALKKPRIPVSATSAGSSSAKSSGYDSYNDYGYDNYNYNNSYDNYYPNYDNYGSSYGDYSGNDNYGSGSSDNNSNDGGSAGGGATNSSTTPNAELGSTNQNSLTKKQKEVVVGAPVAKDPKILAIVTNVIDEMKSISKIIKNNNLILIDSHVQASEETDPADADKANSITIINKEIISLQQEVVTLEGQMKKKNSNTQGYYNTTLIVGIEDYIANIISLSDAIESIDYTKNKSSISGEKNWAYFDGNRSFLDDAIATRSDAQEKIDELKKNIKERVSLLDLENNIKKLLDSFADLKKNTAQKIEKRIVIEESSNEPAKVE